MGLLAQVVLPHSSGIAKDAFVNTFAIGGASGSNQVSDLNAIADTIAGFYNNPAATGNLAMAAAYMSAEVDESALAGRVKLYDISGAGLAGTPHGSPVHERTFTIPVGVAGGANGLPSEVAIAVTLEAANRGNQPVERPDGVDLGSAVDRPRQRYTGRIFFGPVRQSADVMTHDGTGRAFVSPNVIGDLLDAIEWTAEGIATAVPGAFLGVWSRVDEAIRSISHVSVDNAFDTQRRRGAAATARTRRTIDVSSNVELAA